MSRKTFGGWDFAPETEYIGVARGGLGLRPQREWKKIVQPF